MNRDHYHRVLDLAMDSTSEGESFLPHFVRLVLVELTSKHEFMTAWEPGLHCDYCGRTQSEH